MMPYKPINAHPWPSHDGWVIAWFDDEHDRWTAGFIRSDRDEAVAKLKELRSSSPDTPWRLVKETTIYTTEAE